MSEIDARTLVEQMRGRNCPFCGRDPYHYVDNGVGMEAVAVNCCEYGVALFQYGDELLTGVVCRMGEAATALEALSADRDRLDAGMREATGYAARLVRMLVNKHNPDVKQPFQTDDLMGILAQIDTLAAGLVRDTDRDRLRKDNVRLREVISWYASQRNSVLGSDLCIDCGRRAREALSATEDMEDWVLVPRERLENFRERLENRTALYSGTDSLIQYLHSEIRALLDAAQKGDG